MTKLQELEKERESLYQAFLKTKLEILSLIRVSDEEKRLVEHSGRKFHVMVQYSHERHREGLRIVQSMKNKLVVAEKQLTEPQVELVCAGNVVYYGRAELICELLDCNSALTQEIALKKAAEEAEAGASARILTCKPRTRGAQQSVVHD